MLRAITGALTHAPIHVQSFAENATYIRPVKSWRNGGFAGLSIVATISSGFNESAAKVMNPGEVGQWVRLVLDLGRIGLD